MRNVLVIAMEAFGSHEELAFSFTYGFPRSAVLIATCVRQWGDSAGLKPHILNLDAIVHRLPAEDRDDQAVTKAVDAAVSGAIRSYDPALICIVSPYTNMADWATRVAVTCRTAKPDAVIITGGPHASFLAPTLLCRTDKPFDAVLLGPAESKLKHLLQNFDRPRWRFQYPGIATRPQLHGFDDDARTNPVSPPSIDYSILDASEVEPDHGAVIMAGRGCPHACPFCLESLYWRQDRITFDTVAGRVREELLGLHRLGVRVYECGDSLLDMRHSKFTAFCDQAFRGLPLDDHFYVLTRLHMLCSRGAQGFRAAGGKAIWVGLETANQNLLTSMGKGEVSFMARDKLAIAKNAGLRVGAFFMFGYPGETHASARETLAFMSDLFEDGFLDYADCSIFVPYPGLPMFSNPEDYGLLPRDPYWSEAPRWSHWGRYNEPPVFDLVDLSREDVFGYWKKAIAIKHAHDIRETSRDAEVQA